MRGIYILISALLGVACLFYFMPTILINSDSFYKEQSEDEKYNQTYNAKRRELGIPLLPDHWYTRDTSLKPNGFLPNRNNIVKNHWLSQIWSSHEELEFCEPYHKEKEIRRYTREIDNEIDRFVYLGGDTVQYLLELNYSYLGYDKNAWECTLAITKDNKEYTVNYVPLNIAQADSVLATWGMSRTGE